MLSALFDITVNGSRNRAPIFLERGFRGQLFWRENLVYDSRFVARAPWPPSACGHLYVVLEGTWTVSGSPARDTPVALLLTDEEMDRFDATPATRTLRVAGRRDGQGWDTDLALDAGTAETGIHRLWARKKIAGLMDRLREGGDPGEVRSAVVAVALQHRLVSAYTSLVAVDVTPTRPADAGLATGLCTRIRSGEFTLPRAAH